MLPKYATKMNEIKFMLKDIGSKVLQAHEIALDGFEKKNLSSFDEVRVILKNIDEEANRIDNTIVTTFALFGPEATELRELISYMKITNEFVHTGDNAKSYAKNMKVHIAAEFDFNHLEDYIVNLHKCVINSLKKIMELLDDKTEADYEMCYRQVKVEESKADDLYAILEKEILSRVCSKEELSIEYIKALSTFRRLERAADRAVDIARMLLFAKKGGKIKSY